MPNHPHRDAILAAILRALPGSSQGSSDREQAAAAFATAALGQIRTASLDSVPPAAAAAGLSEIWEFVRDANPTGPNVKLRADGRGAVLLSSMLDQPFIVDTIRKALRAHGAVDVAGVHVILRVVRSGEAVRLGSDGEGRAESALRFRFEGVPSTALPAIEEDLQDRLRLASSVVGDFESMTAVIEAIADAAFQVSGEDAIEAAEFLRWLLAENFVFLGVTRTAPNTPDLRLGADRVTSPLWPAAELGRFPGVVQVRKGKVEAPVHRNGRVDVIRIALPGGQTVVRGLFTHRALTQPCRNLPILRRALSGVLADTRQRPNSYRSRGLANIFDSLPTEWLFSATAQQIRSVIELVFDAEQDQQARVHVTQQDEGTTTFTLISIPERRYSEDLRARVQQQLAAMTSASYTDSSLFAGRYDSVLLQVYQTGTRALTDEDFGQLQQHITALTTPWAERTPGALQSAFGSGAAPWTATTAPPANAVALLMELTGASAASIADAWQQALALTRGEALRAALLDAGARAEGIHFAWTQYSDGLEALVAAWLSSGGTNPASERAEDFANALQELARHRGAAGEAHVRIAQYLANGLPAALATDIVDAADALYASEVCLIARARNESIADAARRYQALGHATGLLGAIHTDGRVESRWDPLARRVMRLRYTALLRAVVMREASTTDSLRHIAGILHDVAGQTPEVAALLVAEHKIRAVL
jgi:NAD-specific glutamate dehydrogenase